MGGCVRAKPHSPPSTRILGKTIDSRRPRVRSSFDRIVPTQSRLDKDPDRLRSRLRPHRRIRILRAATMISRRPRPTPTASCRIPHSAISPTPASPGPKNQRRLCARPQRPDRRRCQSADYRRPPPQACGADVGPLPRMFHRIKVGTRRQTQEFSANAGYCAQANLKIYITGDRP